MAEAEALHLARAAGLTTIEPRHLDIGAYPCPLIDPYGRTAYQQPDGPGFVHAPTLLLERAADPDAQVRNLAGAMAMTALIGNSDGRAKNLSLLLDALVYDMAGRQARSLSQQVRSNWSTSGLP